MANIPRYGFELELQRILLRDPSEHSVEGRFSVSHVTPHHEQAYSGPFSVGLNGHPQPPLEEIAGEVAKPGSKVYTVLLTGLSQSLQTFVGNTDLRAEQYKG